MSVKTLAEGRYRLERVLGRGGMASVFLASDTELERPVAIKLLAEHLAHDDTFRRRFLREARMAAGLGHPNIVQVFDAGEEQGSPYIVMEHVDGESLDETRLRRGKLPPVEVVDLAVSICAGLEHAHAAGLVHRDLKPQNLLLRRDGTVKIADFGIARTHGATKLTETGTLLGSAAYLAPEQAAGQEVTSAADIYSLGAVLYELLTGRTPHSFDSLVEFVAKQRTASITPLRELAAEVPEALARVVMRCLALDPKDRPSSAAELAGELADAASLEAPPRPLAEASDRSATEILTAPLTAATTARTVALGEAWQRGMWPRATEILTAPLRAARTARTIALGEPQRWRKWRGGVDARRIALAVVSLVVLSAIAIGLALNSAGTGESPNSPDVRVSPVPRSSDPAQQARELADWLRQQSRGSADTLAVERADHAAPRREGRAS